MDLFYYSLTKLDPRNNLLLCNKLLKSWQMEIFCFDRTFYNIYNTAINNRRKKRFEWSYRFVFTRHIFSCFFFFLNLNCFIIFLSIWNIIWFNICILKCNIKYLWLEFYSQKFKMTHEKVYFYVIRLKGQTKFKEHKRLFLVRSISNIIWFLHLNF